MFNLQGPAIVRALPFAVYILLLALDQPLSAMTEGVGWDARWLYAYRVGAVGLLLAVWWKHYSELMWPRAILGREVWVPLLVGVLVFLLWILPYPAWTALGGGAGFDPTEQDGQLNIMLALIRVAGAALVVPLMEELFWRSFLMRWLERSDFMAQEPARIGLRTLLVASVLFAIEHSLWLAGLLAGLVYGGLYMKYRTLWMPVIAHATTNGLLGCWILKTHSWTYW